MERPALLSPTAATTSLVDSNPGWHLGGPADCKSPFLKDMLAGDSTYHPYRAAADFNGDGLLDQAAVLIKGDSGRIFWFPARNGGYDSAQLLGAVDWITEGGLVVRDRDVLFGKFYSDVVTVWEWNPSIRQLEVVPEPPPED